MIKKRNSKRRATVNLAPMVDISLSLLIMFVLAIPFILESGIFVSRGAAGRAKTTLRKSRQDMTVNIYIRKDGTILLNEEKVDPDSLPVLVAKLLERSVTKKAIVSADSEVMYDRVIQLIDLAKAQGAKDVVIMKRVRRK